MAPVRWPRTQFLSWLSWPGVDSFLRFYMAPLSSTCRAHIHIPTSLGCSHTSPETHIPSKAQIGSQAHSWTIGVHRVKKDWLGWAWVPSQNLMFWKWERAFPPKKKRSVFQEKWMLSSKSKWPVQMPSQKVMGWRDGERKICPFKYAWFFFLQKKKINLQGYALHNSGEMIKISWVYRVLIFSNNGWMNARQINFEVTFRLVKGQVRALSSALCSSEQKTVAQWGHIRILIYHNIHSKLPPVEVNTAPAHGIKFVQGRGNG